MEPAVDWEDPDVTLRLCAWFVPQGGLMKPALRLSLVFAFAAGALFSGLPEAADASVPRASSSSFLPETDPGDGPNARRSRFRVGVTFGGTNLAGVSFELRRGGWAAETSIGSFSLRDVSLAVTAKRYFSGRTFQPYVGAGLWGIGASTEEGRGAALISRFPVGLDWKFVRQHSVGVEVSLNRALWVDRADPTDTDPPSTTLIPIPSLYYRYGATP